MNFISECYNVCVAEKKSQFCYLLPNALQYAERMILYEKTGLCLEDAQKLILLMKIQWRIPKMKFVTITIEDFEELVVLQKAYKIEIGECLPTHGELESLKNAIEQKKIHFYGCRWDNTLVACCSICYTYSTFHYGVSGVLEDFYIQPKYRHQGIARKLVSFAYKQSGVDSLTVGCADCDKAMYQSIGFSVAIGNMLAFEEK